MKKQSLAIMVGALGLLGTTNASAVTVGGVTWDQDSPLDFSSQETIFENDVNAPGDVLNLFGFISAINGTTSATFCTGCSELTFSGSFTVTEAGDFDGDGDVDIIFDSGLINFFSDQDAADFAQTNPASATDGLLWAVMEGNTTDRDFGAGGIKSGQLFAELKAGTVFGDVGDEGSGSAGFDIVGGLALSVLDTNTITTVAGEALTNNPADLAFTNSFQPSNQPGVVVATGEFIGDTSVTVPVPEPASVALLGLGLVALRRFQKS